MTEPIKRKLIEVALPLEAISQAAGREKGIRSGHPSTLHVWWSRKPLAACRAVLFASLVDDPSSDPERFPTLKAQEDERRRLFELIEVLVQWERSNDPAVLAAARAEIRRSTQDTPPIAFDPFCGGGSIPLEAQRLGLTVSASDLNPVAVLISKALVEIPPKFANNPPIHPVARDTIGITGTWEGAAGLAEDVWRYGEWILTQAAARLESHYPPAELPENLGGGKATPIAWLWARTVTCPNPVCAAEMILTSKFALSTKKGKEAWAFPVIDRSAKLVSFEVRSGPQSPGPPPKVGRGASFRCLVCGELAPEQHIKRQATTRGLGTKLMAVVADGPRGRAYLTPTSADIDASQVPSSVGPEEHLSLNARHSTPPSYGMHRFRDLFTDRQRTTLLTFSDLIGDAGEMAYDDAVAAGMDPGDEGLDHGGAGARAYADAVMTYLAFACDSIANLNSSLASWRPQSEAGRTTFSRQALPMTWDFCEVNPLDDKWMPAVLRVSGVLKALPQRAPGAVVEQASYPEGKVRRVLISTDPPYYDNVPYADLSDFFYVWLRRMLSGVYPDLFATVLTPKTAELVADPTRHGGATRSRAHFEVGLEAAFVRMLEEADPVFPMTVYYAFKQAESSEDAVGSSIVASTGWETMLGALLNSGFAIVGTWPIRTEGSARLRSIDSNALASSIVLVCRRRPASAGITDRRGLIAALREELPEALRTLQHGNIAPVDFAQAAIGPGMAVFSRHEKVIEPDGTVMPVRTALGLINQVLAEVLSNQDEEFDANTQWAVAWFDQHGHQDGRFGDAEVLSKAKNTALNALRTAGIIIDGAGRVRLRRGDELDASWDPATDRRLTVWEIAHHLIRLLDEEGEQAAATLVKRVGTLAETARDLAYRLYAICERRKWTEEALGYNALVTAWPELTRLAGSSVTAPRQAELFE